MNYTEYLDFYGLAENEDTRRDWLYSLWDKGVVYRCDGKFYSTENGKEIR